MCNIKSTNLSFIALFNLINVKDATQFKYLLNIIQVQIL
jgi:hypothetical protein